MVVVPSPTRVQRYGEEVAGGAELCCRQFATRLAARGHHVEVATSRAQSARDWADTYPSGTIELDGVTVHRFDGRGPRDNEAFEAKTVEVLWSGTLVPPAEQEQWRSVQGPELAGLVPWLTRVNSTRLTLGNTRSPVGSPNGNVRSYPASTMTFAAGSKTSISASGTPNNRRGSNNGRSGVGIW